MGRIFIISVLKHLVVDVCIPTCNVGTKEIGGFIVGIVTVHETGATGWGIVKTIAINTINGGMIGAMAGAGYIGPLAGVIMEATGVGLSAVMATDSAADTLGSDLKDLAGKACP